MFVGHLAVALAAKRTTPAVPLGTAVAAAFGLDLLWPIFLLLGFESVRIHPGDTAFTHLSFDSYPWSHSLAAVVGWSILAGCAMRVAHRSLRVCAIVGGLVLSHWILDFLTHRPDLPLWPGGPVVGLGLWYSIPGTLIVEGGLLAACLWIYVRGSAPRDRTGRWALVALVALTLLIWSSQPWSPPPPSSEAVAWGALILWLLPPWARWIDQHRRG
ncbi:MAG: hypothetical protein HOP16_16710 [Acidobacteria bacterium]|nr:hypothetical protein [Acidobacteriota bacterium]